MGRINVYVLALVLFAVPVPGLAAQVPLAKGDRVRVSAPAFAPDDIIGTVAGVRDDTIVVDVSWRTAPVDVPLSTVASLERAWGYQTRTVRGTLIGAGLGLLAGAIAFDDDDVGQGSLMVVGAVVGGFLGSRMRVERWRAAPTEARWMIGASVEF